MQRVTTTDLLPIPEDVLQAGEEQETDEQQRAFQGDFIYEPEPEEILQRLLPVYLETEIYRVAARIGGVVPRVADDRDAERVEERRRIARQLTLAMNRARQAEITQEILEVVAGADALAG